MITTQLQEKLREAFSTMVDVNDVLGKILIGTIDASDEKELISMLTKEAQNVVSAASLTVEMIELIIRKDIIKSIPALEKEREEDAEFIGGLDPDIAAINADSGPNGFYYSE